MKYIFWQNILSIHQSAFLSSLSRTSDVTLVVEQKLESLRMKDGWNIPEFGNVKVIIAPDKERIVSLLADNKNAIHIFSGLDAYVMVRYAMNMAISQKIKIGIMLEPFDWLGWKGWLRKLKYQYLKIKYNKHISFLLTIGDKGRWCYESIGFPKSKIYDWGYFTVEKEIIDGLEVDSMVDNKPTLIYIGRFNKEKGILPLLETSLRYKDKFSKFYLIGDGVCMQDAMVVIKDFPQYVLLGNIPNEQVYKYLFTSDLCILPSIGKDGWGAVVNEALMCGTPVIASDHCGASVLLNGDYKGEVFSVKRNNLEEILNKWILKGKLSEDTRMLIKEWADDNISGSVAANYFEKVVKYIQVGGERPIAPWLDKSRSI